MDKNELEYRMFIWPVYDEYTALIMRVHKDDTVDLWNVETGEWDSSRDATEIYGHELKNDTTWEILERISYMANAYPYDMEHEDIARIEEKNKEILELYKLVKGRAKITLAEGEGLYERVIPELKIVDGYLCGTGVTFTDGKYAFFLQRYR